MTAQGLRIIVLTAAMLLGACGGGGGGGSDGAALPADSSASNGPGIGLDAPRFCISDIELVGPDASTTLYNLTLIGPDAGSGAGAQPLDLTFTNQGLVSGAVVGMTWGGSVTGAVTGITIEARSGASDVPFRGIDVSASLTSTGTLTLRSAGHIALTGQVSAEHINLESGAIAVPGDAGNPGPPIDADLDEQDSPVIELTALPDCSDLEPTTRDGRQQRAAESAVSDDSGWVPGGLHWTGELTIEEHGHSFSFAEIDAVPDLEAPAVPLAANRIDGIIMLRGPNIDGRIRMRLPGCTGHALCGTWQQNPRFEPSWYALDEQFEYAAGPLMGFSHGMSDTPLSDYDGLLRQVGMAADGYPIANGWFDDNGLLRRATSSYQLKTGQRPTGFLNSNPTGFHTGEYVQDYEYVPGSGDLDECNGMVVNGVYAYFMTPDFPYLMNCLRGTPHASFEISAP